MNARMSPEEARDAMIRERTAKNADHTKALLAAGDLAAIRVVGDCVTDYLASAYDDLHKLVIGETTFEQVRDKVIEIEAETQAIKQVERMEQVRQEQAQQARIERAAWNREIGYLI
jgi:23S rRNA G2069 N7-methylase RlmK/C1962 C5-methylase RlmI